MAERRRGSCLCGRIRFEVEGDVRPVIACHCRQCRKQSGHIVAATQAPLDKVDMVGAEHLTWYRASEAAQRGFCSHCGSLLFWRPDNEPMLSIMAGSFDEPSGLRLEEHIYCCEQGDYYNITDDLPKHMTR